MVDSVNADEVLDLVGINLIQLLPAVKLASRESLRRIADLPQAVLDGHDAESLANDLSLGKCAKVVFGFNPGDRS